MNENKKQINAINENIDNPGGKSDVYIEDGSLYFAHLETGEVNEDSGLVIEIPSLTIDDGREIYIVPMKLACVMPYASQGTASDVICSALYNHHLKDQFTDLDVEDENISESIDSLKFRSDEMATQILEIHQKKLDRIRARKAEMYKACSKTRRVYTIKLKTAESKI